MKPTRLLPSIAVTLLLGAVPALAEWQFAIPPGWTDISPGKPVPKGIPGITAGIIESHHFHTYAMDLKDATDEFANRNLEKRAADYHATHL